MVKARPSNPASGPRPAPVGSYRWLHGCYAVLILALVATALPIQFPDLRAKLIGGYGTTIATIHEWLGVTMAALPVVFLAVAPARAWRTARARGRRRRWLGIHAFNLWFTLVSGLVFVSSGFAIWFQEFLADPLVDISYSLHVAFSWVLYVLIPLHLASAASRALKVVSAWRVSLRTYARDRFPDTAAIKNAETITEDLPCY